MWPAQNAASTPIEFADSVALDSFGRLRVSQSFTLFDSQQEYGLDTLRLWDISANGTPGTPATNGSATSGINSVGPRDAATRMTPITVSATSGHYAVLQSRQYSRYVPGKGHLVFITGIFAATAGASAAIVRRTSTSGSQVDTTIARASWNIDKFDGSGPSGVALDLTKTQILFIQAQWLGVGRVIVGFDVDGVLYPAHQFLNANSLIVPYSQSFNLPVRVEARTGASSTTYSAGYFDAANGIMLQTTSAAGGTVQFVCCSVQTEGGEIPRGFPCSAPAGITPTAVTTRRPILSIRPKASYNGITNRAHINDIKYALRTVTNDSLVEVVIGGTLTGASWVSVGTESVAEYDTSATSITGGTAVTKGFALAGQGVSAQPAAGGADIRAPLILSQIDSLAATQTNISIVCTSFSGTSSVTPAMNWHELVV